MNCFGCYNVSCDIKECNECHITLCGKCAERLRHVGIFECSKCNIQKCQAYAIPKTNKCWSCY